MNVKLCIWPNEGGWSNISPGSFINLMVALGDPIFTESAHLADSVFCPLPYVVETSGWRKFSLWFPVMTQFSKKNGGPFSQFWTSLLWIVGELAGDGLWLWQLAVCTSTALQWHFHNTSTALPRHFQALQKKLCQCFFQHWSRDLVSPVHGIWVLRMFSKCLDLYFKNTFRIDRLW